MGEREGTYRALQTPGARLGAQLPAGVSTLEPRQAPSAGTTRMAARTQEKCLLLRVKLLDSSVEMFDVEVRSVIFGHSSLYFLLFFLKILFIYFREGEGMQKERERNISV